MAENLLLIFIHSLLMKFMKCMTDIINKKMKFKVICVRMANHSGVFWRENSNIIYFARNVLKMRPY